MEKISTSNLIRSTATELNMTYSEVKGVVETFFEYVLDELNAGNQVNITPYIAFRFGYKPPIKKGTMVMNPFEGKKVPSAGRAASIIVKARLLKEIKEAAPSPGSKAGKELINGMKK
jgi:nucleoid DNA-binding protein